MVGLERAGELAVLGEQVGERGVVAVVGVAREQQRQAAAFDLIAIRRGQSADPPIYPGDIVVVDGSAIKEGFKRVVQSFPILSIFRPF